MAINAPAELVWHYLTVERALWWPDMRFDARVGSRLVETWIEGGRLVSAIGVVTRCDAPELLSFGWRERGWSLPLVVDISLRPRVTSTSVRIAESGFVRARTVPTLPDEHEEGWLYHLDRLKRLCEEQTAGAAAR